jgi:hypothetical protein
LNNQVAASRIHKLKSVANFSIRFLKLSEIVACFIERYFGLYRLGHQWHREYCQQEYQNSLFHNPTVFD